MNQQSFADIAPGSVYIQRVNGRDRLLIGDPIVKGSVHVVSVEPEFRIVPAEEGCELVPTNGNRVALPVSVEKFFENVSDFQRAAQGEVYTDAEPLVVL